MVPVALWRLFPAVVVFGALLIVAAACGESEADPRVVTLTLEGRADGVAQPLGTSTVLGEIVLSACTRELNERVTGMSGVDLGAGPVELPLVEFDFEYGAVGTVSGETPAGRPIAFRLDQSGTVAVDFARLTSGQATNDLSTIAAAYAEESTMKFIVDVPVRDGEVRQLEIVDRTPNRPDLQVIDHQLVATFDSDQGTFIFQDTATDRSRLGQFCDWRIELETLAPSWYVKFA